MRSVGGKNVSTSKTPSLRSGGVCTSPISVARSRSRPARHACSTRFASSTNSRLASGSAAIPTSPSRLITCPRSRRAAPRPRSPRQSAGARSEPTRFSGTPASEPGRVDRHVVARRGSPCRPWGRGSASGMPAASASSSSTIPSPVLPEPVMPTITPCVVRSAGSSSSGAPSSVVPEQHQTRRRRPCGWPGRRGRAAPSTSVPGVGRALQLRPHGGVAQLDQVVVDDDRVEASRPRGPRAARPRRRSTTARSTAFARRVPAAIAAGSSASPSGRLAEAALGDVAVLQPPQRRGGVRVRRGDGPVGGLRGRLAVERRVARAARHPVASCMTAAWRGDARVERRERTPGREGPPAKSRRAPPRCAAAARGPPRSAAAACAGCRRRPRSISAAAAIPVSSEIWAL